MAGKIKIALPGAAGRMGRAIAGAVESRDGFEIIATTEIGDDPKTLIAAKPDVIVDFTIADASVVHAGLAAQAGIPVIIGTSGHDDRQRAQLEEAAQKTPLLLAANTSVGVTALHMLVEQTASRLDADGWDIEIMETHHHHKVDAPSGTALALGRAAAQGRGVDFGKAADYARHGMPGAREKGTIGFAVARGGDVVGEHRVLFFGDGEEIELRHRATNRGIYAAGVLRAAVWIIGREAGFYTMNDVLGDGT